jgi:hypothetical protein
MFLFIDFVDLFLLMITLLDNRNPKTWPNTMNRIFFFGTCSSG